MSTNINTKNKRYLFDIFCLFFSDEIAFIKAKKTIKVSIAGKLTLKILILNSWPKKIEIGRESQIIFDINAIILL